MSPPTEPLRVTIDNRALTAAPGTTILKAARTNGIAIPTLCFLDGLSPFGGCRMCIVEVEGMSRFPTACTTPVEEGMVIRTHTAQVQAVRYEVLQLILSEHPASCLVCEERERCSTFQGTIRKAGATTGCRTCPSDRQCELQELAARLGMEEIHYPVSYRNLRVEREDPFYDRDYNLCVLCGRCVRVCQEVRTAATLAFTHRGNRTVIGPAFGRTHLEAGCEFCGACLEVCPTGALAEKVRKWDGPAEREQTTTCPLCGIGCQLRLQLGGDTVLGSLPVDAALPHHGQLCVKGRFCLPELLDPRHRLLRPRQSHGDTAVEVTWDEAVLAAAERIAACPPERFQLLLSPDLSTETLYLAQKLARTAVGSRRVDTTARDEYGECFPGLVRLLGRSSSLAAVEEADAVLSVGLDARFARSVVGVELRRAVDRGAQLVTVHCRDHGLTRIAHWWLRPRPGTSADLLGRLERAIAAVAARPGRKRAKRPADELGAAAAALAGAARPVVVVGPDLLVEEDGPALLAAVARLSRALGAAVVTLPAGANLTGSILAGAYRELVPGGRASGDGSGPGDEVEVLYLLGVSPPPGPRQAFVILQDLWPPPPSTVDLALPAASFAEEDGTVVGGDRQVRRWRRAVPPPGEALPDWEILCRIARAMGVRGFDFATVAEVHAELSTAVTGLGDFDQPPVGPLDLVCDAELSPAAAGPSADEHSYRGMPLEHRVAGARALFGQPEPGPATAERG